MQWRPVIPTFSATEHHCLLTGTKLYCSSAQWQRHNDMNNLLRVSYTAVAIMLSYNPWWLVQLIANAFVLCWFLRKFFVYYPRRQLSQRSGFYLCLFVCLSVFMHIISKTDAARIIKLGTEMFQDESWKSSYFGVNVPGHKSQKHCQHGSLQSCECWFLPVWILLNNVQDFCFFFCSWMIENTYRHVCVLLLKRSRCRLGADPVGWRSGWLKHSWNELDRVNNLWCVISPFFSSSVLTLLVGWRGGYPARIKHSATCPLSCQSMRMKNIEGAPANPCCLTGKTAVSREIWRWCRCNTNM